jgi:hypothetical protein
MQEARHRSRRRLRLYNSGMSKIRHRFRHHCWILWCSNCSLDDGSWCFDKLTKGSCGLVIFTDARSPRICCRAALTALRRYLSQNQHNSFAPFLARRNCSVWHGVTVAWGRALQSVRAALWYFWTRDRCESVVVRLSLWYADISRRTRIIAFCCSLHGVVLGRILWNIYWGLNELLLKPSPGFFFLYTLQMAFVRFTAKFSLGTVAAQ